VCATRGTIQDPVRCPPYSRIAGPGRKPVGEAHDAADPSHADSCVRLREGLAATRGNPRGRIISLLLALDRGIVFRQRGVEEPDAHLKPNVQKPGPKACVK
jgi:hypothetical protein